MAVVGSWLVIFFAAALESYEDSRIDEFVAATNDFSGPWFAT